MNSHNDLLRDALHAERNATRYRRWLAKGGPSRRQAEFEHAQMQRLIEGLERRQQAARQIVQRGRHIRAEWAPAGAQLKMPLPQQGKNNQGESK